MSDSSRGNWCLIILAHGKQKKNLPLLVGPGPVSIKFSDWFAVLPLTLFYKGPVHFKTLKSCIHYAHRRMQLLVKRPIFSFY